MKIIIFILPTVFLTLYGQFITKWRVADLARDVESVSVINRIIRYIGDPFILSTYLMTLVASFSWFFVLERYELSLAYPLFIGLMFVAVILCDSILFGASLNGTKLISIALILFGVIIGSR
jgi:multidrug transporter EmrE-like cation transporter